MRRTLQTLTWFFLRRPRSGRTPCKDIRIQRCRNLLSEVTIPYGTSSVPYSVHVEEGGYRLFYVLDNADSGVYTDKKMAKVFNVYNQNISGYKLKLLEKRRIVPDGAFENEGYFEVKRI